MHLYVQWECYNAGCWSIYRKKCLRLQNPVHPVRQICWHMLLGWNWIWNHVVYPNPLTRVQTLFYQFCYTVNHSSRKFLKIHLWQVVHRRKNRNPRFCILRRNGGEEGSFQFDQSSDCSERRLRERRTKVSTWWTWPLSNSREISVPLE